MGKKKTPLPIRASVRAGYVQHGVAAYYQQSGAAYRNPHEPIIRAILAHVADAWALDLRAVLDLACGSGEVTLAWRDLPDAHIVGMDPYTGAAYRARTGQDAEPFTFEQIAGGALHGRRYTLIACSFALHLVAESRLPALCYQFAQIAPRLLIVSPHKRPPIQPAWGWTLMETYTHERVHARLYAAQPRVDMR
jgi:SAM-dependent methyltransferase